MKEKWDWESESEPEDIDDSQITHLICACLTCLFYVFFGGWGVCGFLFFSPVPLLFPEDTFLTN